MIHRSLLVGLLVVQSVGAHAAEVEANIGWVSDYIFRGVPQKTSSASAGIDLTNEGFYIGAWGADVGQGSEVDVYGGYGGSYQGFDFSIGATGYFYTDDFDDTYTELNLGLGWEFITLDVALGSYDNFSGPTQDYRFLALGASFGDAGITIGSFGDDFDGEYVELSYGWELEDFGISISYIHSTSDLLGDTDNSIVFGVAKSFALSE